MITTTATTTTTTTTTTISPICSLSIPTTFYRRSISHKHTPYFNHDRSLSVSRALYLPHYSGKKSMAFYILFLSTLYVQ